jgi:hypothetical protein
MVIGRRMGARGRGLSEVTWGRALTLQRRRPTTSKRRPSPQRPTGRTRSPSTAPRTSSRAPHPRGHLRRPTGCRWHEPAQDDGALGRKEFEAAPAQFVFTPAAAAMVLRRWSAVRRSCSSARAWRNVEAAFSACASLVRAPDRLTVAGLRAVALTCTDSWATSRAAVPRAATTGGPAMMLKPLSANWSMTFWSSPVSS